MRRERALKVVLVVVGLLFTAGVIPLTMFFSRAINKAGRTWGNGFTPKVIWSIVREGAANRGLTGLAPHDRVEGVRASVIRHEVSSNRASFSSDTFPSKLLSATWAANSAFKMR
jgi:hypothetical protein